MHLRLKFHEEGVLPESVIITNNVLLIPMLLKQKTDLNDSLTRIKWLLIICAFESSEAFVRKLLKKSKRKRKTDYETECRMIERMVMTGNADGFYDELNV